ncbi:MAG TPA: enoyl-CoA hydratase/isomerase family protein [Deinococcales bacterium]|nr:enoyl-CoA hydratase/isomerase family protein [Deinococcales bacterium]
MRRPYVGLEPEAYDFQFIRYEKSGYTATVTFNRPEVLNAVNLGTLEELQLALKDAAWDDDVAVLVLTGAGERAFCTGADMREQAQFQERPRDYYKWMGEFIACHELIRNLGKPSIARLNGIVVGGGNEFNMSCDLAVMVDGAYIRQVGATHGSVAAAGATQFLPILVGDRRAREILLLNEEIPAAKALEWGLVNRVVPRAQLDETVAAIAAKLYGKFPDILRYTRQQLNFWRDLSWHMTIGHARDWLAIHNVSREVEEGVAAFGAKRRPDHASIREAAARDERPEFPLGLFPTKAGIEEDRGDDGE